MLDSEMVEGNADETKDQQDGNGWSGGILDADGVVAGVMGVFGHWGVEMVEMKHLLQDHRDVLVSLLIRSRGPDLLPLRSCDRHRHRRLAFAKCDLEHSVQAASGKDVEMAGEMAGVMAGENAVEV